MILVVQMVDSMDRIEDRSVRIVFATAVVSDMELRSVQPEAKLAALLVAEAARSLGTVRLRAHSHVRSSAADSADGKERAHADRLRSDTNDR